MKKDSFDSEVSEAMQGGGLSPGNANKLSTANHLQKILIFLPNHSFLFYPCGCVFHSDIHPDTESDTCEKGIWLGMLKLKTQARYFSLCSHYVAVTLHLEVQGCHISFSLAIQRDRKQTTLKGLCTFLASCFS